MMYFESDSTKIFHTTCIYTKDTLQVLPSEKNPSYVAVYFANSLGKNRVSFCFLEPWVNWRAGLTDVS